MTKNRMGQVRRARIAVVAPLAVLLSALYYGCLWVRHVPTSLSEEPQTTSEHLSEFDWFSITPRKTFEWSPCYSGQKCARLLLPMDYDTPDGPPIAIAVRMIPATDLDNYRGTIFFNPGGPGGSGVEYVADRGKHISMIVGPSFDVLGFDPRGVGRSTPQATCFDTPSQRDIWATQEGHPLVNVSVGVIHARAQVVAKRCEERLGGEWGIGHFASSTYVARDMLEMAQLLGQEKLQYWGFSYGTLLGQYFATMYPDKIQRFVLDGISDAELYRVSSYATDIEDVDSIIDSLFTYCFKAGSEKCSLYASSPGQIRERYFTVINELARNPVAVHLADPPAVLTHKILLDHLYASLFKPLLHFPVVADTIYALETSNASALAILAPQVLTPTTCDCSTERTPFFGRNEASRVVECSDGAEYAYSDDAFARYYAPLTQVSSTIAPVWARYWIECADWRMRPRWNFTAPFEAANTSHPILAISTRYDPVTPISHARRVVQRFGGAVLLTQESYGHCSVSAPSRCTAKYVRDYFFHGTMPEEGATCNADELPFIGPTQGKDLWEAMRDIAASMPVDRRS